MKVLAILLILLVGTMISGMPMKSYADPQLDTLLNIATQAKDNLGATISQINNVPDEINKLYKQGSNETDELAQAAAQQDVGSAKQHFLAAMKFFKETNDQINSLNTTAANDQQKTEIIQLRGEIVRLENMGNLLKSIALQNNLDINFTNFDVILQNATQDITSGNLDDASKQVQSANDFVIATHNSLTEAAQEKNSERAKDFTEKQIAQLNVNQTTNQNTTSYYPNNTSSNTNRTNLTQNNMPTNLPIQNNTANNSNTTIENNPSDMVTKLKQLVAEGKVDQAINLIKIIQAYQKVHSAQKLAEVTSNNTTSAPLPPPSAPLNNTTSAPLPPPSAPLNNTTSAPLPPPSAPLNNTTSAPLPPPSAPLNNTTSAPLPPPSAPLNNTTSAPLPPPSAPLNNTTSTPPSHQTQENQTTSGHGTEHNGHGKKHNEGTTSDKNQHSRN